MTAAEFNRTVKQFPRLSDHAKALAKAVLVDGSTYEEVISQYGVSRQLASEWCLKVYRAFFPKGWVTESITLPAEKMDLVRQMQAKEMERWEKASKRGA
uniref:TrfB-related DNA-binding protein n=1 Tax=Sulfuriferula sp. GW6 TaxID=3345112 RepID=UPI0039F73BCD